MIFGDRRGCWGASRDEAPHIVERFAEAGGNFIDTANSFAGGGLLTGRYGTTRPLIDSHRHPTAHT